MGKCLDALLFCAYLAHPVITGIFLGILGCHFRQSFRRSDADRDGYADTLADVPNQLLAKGFLFLLRHMIDIDEALINGVLLKACGMGTEDGHYPVRQIAIQGEIRGEAHDSFFLHQCLDLVERCAHGDAECFGFVGT